MKGEEFPERGFLARRQPSGHFPWFVIPAGDARGRQLPQRNFKGSQYSGMWVITWVSAPARSGTSLARSSSYRGNFSSTS